MNLEATGPGALGRGTQIQLLRNQRNQHWKTYTIIPGRSWVWPGHVQGIQHRIVLYVVPNRIARQMAISTSSSGDASSDMRRGLNYQCLERDGGFSDRS